MRTAIGRRFQYDPETSFQICTSTSPDEQFEVQVNCDQGRLSSSWRTFPCARMRCTHVLYAKGVAFVTVAVIVGLIVCLRHTAPSEKPHIIVFIVDDMGWSDVSFQNAPQIPTPNLDAMCADGVQLQSHYAHPSCTPSRAALLTGKYPIRMGLQEFVITPGGRDAVSLEHTLLPQHLKELGYETHLVGKWHLGFYDPAYLPEKRGFDTFYGYYNGAGSYYDHVLTMHGHTGYDWHGNSGVDKSVNGTYVTDLITKRVQTLVKQRDPLKPMFLMVSHMAPHGGSEEDVLEVDEKWVTDPAIKHIGNEQRTKYAGMVRALDAAFGETIAALDGAGMLENSVILFTSDNGGTSIHDEGFATGASNWPLRGQKMTLWEGGSRVVSFIWSPLLKTRHYLNSHLYHFTDWFFTFYKLAGGNLAKLPRDGLDGHDIWDSISRNEESPRKDLLVNYDTGGDQFFAVRKGNFKLVTGTPPTINVDWWNNWYAMPGGALDNATTVLQDHMKQSKVYNILRNRQDFKERPDNWRQHGQIKCQLSDHIPHSPQGSDYRDYTVDEMSSSTLMVNNVTLCHDPAKEACLFDIVRDPCEVVQYTGGDRDRIIKELREMGEAYRAVTVEAICSWADRDKHFDIASIPELHDGAWVPWVNVAFEENKAVNNQ